MTFAIASASSRRTQRYIFRPKKQLKSVTIALNYFDLPCHVALLRCHGFNCLVATCNLVAICSHDFATLQRFCYSGYLYNLVTALSQGSLLRHVASLCCLATLPQLYCNLVTAPIAVSRPRQGQLPSYRKSFGYHISVNFAAMKMYSSSTHLACRDKHNGVFSDRKRWP
ncbi:hypothetical protein GGR50DRAFT_684850 [Xylaria sp. CBS 124048]|nr:hypothetical protein GGR50DRAFT_684850 [Xylaria sp. CBS 124048]